MISRFIIAMMKNGSERAATENGINSRLLVLFAFLGIILCLFIIILKNIKKKRIRIITALILSAILIFEASGVIPYLQGKKHVPLEYVGSVETTRNDSPNSEVKWVTNYSAPLGSEPSKKWLEGWLKCDLTNIALNEDAYGYLFVLYYKNVDLFYSNWSESASHKDCWIGHVEESGEAADHEVYIFRFPKKVIVPTEPDDIMWWEELVD